MRRMSVAAVLALVAALWTGVAAAAPPEAVHELDWYVHVDLIDAGAGEDLAYYEDLLTQRIAESNLLLQGHQGPADAGCCVTFDPVSVATFGTPGDGLDVIDDGTELATVYAGPAGAYLTQSVFHCGGTTSTTIRGCAEAPGDRMVVALDSEGTHFLPTVIAHERGHNGGLGHVAANPCQLMGAMNGGGCLSVSECNAFVADADAAGGSCACLADTVGDVPAPIGTACVDTSGCGLCSGGVCGACTSLAGASLFAAGGPGSASGVAPEDAIVQAGASGDWDVLASLGSSVTGLARDPVAEVVYGIEERVGDDALVTIDPVTGAITSTVGILTGREMVTALAYDPTGARLLAIEVDDDFFGSSCLGAVGIDPPCFSALFEIDPVTAGQTNLGELNSQIITDGIQALAWDDANGTLYDANAAGLSTVNLASCDGFTCAASGVDTIYRDPVSLTWDPTTGLLIREGGNGFGGHMMDVIDTATGSTLASRGLDVWTAGGLTVLPVPEPGTAAQRVAAVLALAVLALRRRR